MSVTKFKSKRRFLSSELSIKADIAEVFPLMCPVMEHEWLEDWECEMIHSTSGVAELGCVFTTYNEDDGGKDIWVISQFEVFKKIAFIRVNQWRSIHYTLDFTFENNKVSIIWIQEITSLNKEGNRLLASIKQEQFTQQIKDINTALKHYLKRGSCLRLAS
ncbi:MAG: hypothetical protein ACSHWU_09085 [Marinicella sp.]